MRPSLDTIHEMFVYHPPSTPERVAAHKAVNDITEEAARQILTHCPGCEELTLAIRRLQEARMWANAGIALHLEENTKAVASPANRPPSSPVDKIGSGESA